MSAIQPLPITGYLKLKQIIGDQKASPPIPAIIPVCKSSWYAGIKKGRYPKSVRISARSIAWRVEDIRDLIIELGKSE